MTAEPVKGGEALAFRDAAVKAKGSALCPRWVRVEIKLAIFGYWRLLTLQSPLIADANERGTIINKRLRELPNIHAQYDTIDARFLRRCESLALDKGAGLDLARRLIAEKNSGTG